MGKEYVEKACSEKNLMIDGAFEVLNEWSFDHTDEQLIEDGELVYINIHVAKEILSGDK
jgi:hypothetical protein